MSSTWETKVATLIERTVKGAEDLTIVERLELAWLESRGRIETDQSGETVKRSVQKSEPPAEGHAEGAVIDFAPRALWDQAEYGWRGYVATDLMYRQEEMQAKGDVVIVNRFASMLDNLTKAVKNHLHLDLYCDGGASGNEAFLEGVRTFTGHTAGSTAASDKIAYPGDTYHEILCTPGQEGDWSAAGTAPNAALASDWPDGQGDSEWHYWTPILAKTDSTAFGDGGGWAEECEEIMTDVNLWMRLVRGTSGSEMLLATDGRMNAQFKAKMRSKNYHLAPFKQALDLGFPDVLNYEGMGVYATYALPANTGIVWNFEKVTLYSVAPTLLYSDGPTWSTEKQAWLVLVGYHGNLDFTPRYFAELGAFTASA